MLLPLPDALGLSALATLALGAATGLPLPAETALAAAGGLAVDGHVSLAWIVLVGALAAMAGDGAGFLVGRRGGRRALLRGGRSASRRRRALARADRFFARHGLAAVVLARWVPGVRAASSIAAGASGLPWRRFLAADALGATLWAGTLATLASAIGTVGCLLVVALGFAAAGALGAIGRAARPAAPHALVA